ncbi:MAG: SpaA isopeptide-forming pilin-related protein [Clostridia bacterium]
MSKLKTKKIIGGLLLIIVLITTFQNTIYAVSMNQRILIQNYGECDYTLQFKRSDGVWSYVTCVFAGYSENGKVYPAYCVNRGLDGVGEREAYNVDLTKLMDDYRLWRVAINGYPYKTPEEMGVDNKYDAFLATKQAIYSILYNNDVDTYYRGGNERGVKVHNAIKRMVNEGRNGTYTPQDANVTINKVGGLKEETNYYSQEYSVSSRVSMSTYTIINTLNMPSGAYIADLNGNKKTTFNGGNNFKVMIPKSSMGQDFDIIINISSKCKSYPVFYGQTTIAGTQNYLITADPYGDFVGRANLQIKGNTSVLKIKKIDQETKETLKGVTFELKGENGKVIGTYTTNSSGEIEIKDLYPQTVTLTEISTKDEYVLNSTPVTVKLEWNKTSSVTLENMHKKGNLKIVKVDKDDNDLTLGAVEFDLIDFSGNIVKHLVTDVNGVAEVKNINTGNYTLRETLTKKEYNLAVDQNVLVNWNETMEYKVENEKKKGQIKIIKVDADYNEVKLEGVEFQIIDKNNHIIETIKTNSNGEAVTSRIPIGNYKIKEVSLGTNEEYILNDEVKTITVEEDKIKTIQFENEHKKGNLKIYKVDLDDNTLPVSDVEFEIIDQDGYKYTAISDENGIAYITDIRTGIATIREVKTNKIYKLLEETYEADIKWNETTEMTITNEKLKGQIEVYKVDSEDKEIKLEGVEFQVINSNDEVVETIVTDSNGYAITSHIPIGEYRLKEIKTDNMHILNENIIKVDVSTDIISRLDITNERIKGQIKVIKTSEDDNFINGKGAGSPIENVKFEVYDLNNNLVDEITTLADGTAITRLLDKGCYFIKEVESGEWYLLNENTFTAEIKEHQEIVNVEITNESEKPDVDIEKTGIIQTTANQEIKYDFHIKNTGNVPLDKFTWIDSLPTDYVRITKLITGTYNQDLNYSIYYKTNKNDYRLLKDNLNTQVNNYIDFSNLELEADEYVTDFKADFGTVDVGFESVINPYIFVRVNSNVQNDDIFTNKTRIEGYNKTYMVWDEDDHTTKVYEKEIEVKKLPRTGM